MPLLLVLNLSQTGIRLILKPSGETGPERRMRLSLARCQGAQLSNRVALIALNVELSVEPGLALAVFSPDTSGSVGTGFGIMAWPGGTSGKNACRDDGRIRCGR